MGTTTIRIDSTTHEQLVALSRSSGATLIETVRDATEALRRDRLGARVAQELDQLRSDPEAWSAYIAESEHSVRDGIG